MGHDIPTIGTLDETVELVLEHSDLYVRWSRGPEYDNGSASSDSLTGVPLPGLSASPLTIEEWWGDRSPKLWTARRLYDYRHLREVRDGDVRPWLLVGRVVARGPDNEPLITCEKPVAWVDERVIDEAIRLVDAQTGDWGPLRREG